MCAVFEQVKNSTLSQSGNRFRNYLPDSQFAPSSAIDIWPRKHLAPALRLLLRHLQGFPHIMQLLPDKTQVQVAQALFRGVRTPLEALRIILEDLEAGTADHSVLPGIIDALQRVRRNVESVEQYFRPTEDRTMSVSVREIAYGVRDQLAETQRSSLLIALDANDDRLSVDAPILIRSLARLAANSIECSHNPVLLRVQRSDGGFNFSIVGHGQRAFNYFEAAQAFASTKHGHVGLGLTLAIRDIRQLGGDLEIRTGSSFSTRFEVSIPQGSKEVEAA